MIISIDEQNPVPIFRQISRQVKMQVAAGELGAGAPLPSIRELAVRLSVNPNTVGKAFRELEREGVIVMKRGIGAFVAENRPDSLIRHFSDEVIDGKVRDLVQTAKSLKVSRDVLVKKIDTVFKGGTR